MISLGTIIFEKLISVQGLHISKPRPLAGNQPYELISFQPVIIHLSSYKQDRGKKNQSLTVLSLPSESLSSMAFIDLVNSLSRAD